MIVGIYLLFLVALTIVAKTFVYGCTTIAVGKKATTDGSVMGTHSNDGGGTTDPRLVKVPAQDFPANSMRPIWSSPENYPRYVGTERKVAAYFPENCQAGDVKCKTFVPVGYIPQVNHTYAYYEATYGVMNEKQVGISESTCSSVFVASSIAAGGKALLSVDQLSQIAMERASTAKQAVQLMGDLAVQYGFYGESRSFEGGAESLIVTDPNEAWVFHILADPSEASAIWVAARVPDDSVAVVANMFIVRDVNLADTNNFLGRSDMWEIAQAQGLWAPGQPMDFTATFSDGEYAHKYYSGRRMWGIFNLFAPSQALPADYVNLKTSKPYPFAVPVDKPVSVQDVMQGMRYWYNGTAYSTSDGLQGGAFGSPDRFSGGSGENQVSGSWERTIGLYRSSDSYIVQSRNWLKDDVGGIVWFGPAAAHATNYVPLLAGMSVSPDCLQYGWQGVYNTSTAFWIHRLTLNIAQIKFSAMIEDIRALQNELETSSLQLISLIDQNNNNLTMAEIESMFVNNAEMSVVRFAGLINTMLFTYADNYLNYWSNTGFHSSSTGYPAWWLEAVGYPNGPPPVNNANTDNKSSKQKKDNNSDSSKYAKYYATLAQKERESELQEIEQAVAGTNNKNSNNQDHKIAYAYTQQRQQERSNRHTFLSSNKDDEKCLVACAKAYQVHAKDASLVSCLQKC